MVYIEENEAKQANSDVVKGLEAQVLLAKGCCVILIANLQTKAELVNRSMSIVQDILFEKQESPALFKAMFIKFEKYNRSNIITTEGVEVVPIVSIKCSWEDKNRITCSRIQVLLCLTWAITVYKS